MNRRLQVAIRIIITSIDLLDLEVEAKIGVVSQLLGCGYFSGINSDWTSLGGFSLNRLAQVSNRGVGFVSVDIGNVKAFSWVQGLADFLPPLMTCGVDCGKGEFILAFVHVVGVEFNLGSGSVLAADELVCLRVGRLPVSLEFRLVLSGQS